MTTELKDEENVEVALPLPPGAPVVEYDPLVEPAYGWVVCISMHLINGFTWGVIAVRKPFSKCANSADLPSSHTEYSFPTISTTMSSREHQIWTIPSSVE
jgi:hypothetical protein